MVENEKIINIIDAKKNEFREIMIKYIDENCVQFKKEEMKSLFVGKFVELAESMTAKFKEKEGKFYDKSNSNTFTKDMENQNKSNNVSFIDSNKSDITNPSL